MLDPELDGRLEGVMPREFDYFLQLIGYDLLNRICIEEAVAAARVLDAIDEALRIRSRAEVVPI
ncbi:hypothetical protein QF046_002954 [Microbacterium sp. W4I4]|uniref:hypothetical protein n=1 Tax=Microbacterium sp. W4I4 TaxID=3042295 RepID=UPI002781BD0D|nr:hypothetical protein [Microbacterium sp. W4I4]MDQ0615313.1 hypothetical protein [Microbacterium sp. W4I4]